MLNKKVCKKCWDERHTFTPQDTSEKTFEHLWKEQKHLRDVKEATHCVASGVPADDCPYQLEHLLGTQNA